MAFLDGVPLAVEPTAIEQTLASLWQAPTEDGATPAATRLSLGTLVIVADAADGEELDAICRQISGRHPSRLVVALLGGEREAALTAAVAALCHLPQPGQPQVCSEIIVLRAGEGLAERLPGAILPLLLPDVLATLWWRRRQPPGHGLARDLASVMDRVLVDLAGSADPQATWREFDACPDCASRLTDLSWWRLSPWREGLAQCFDGQASAEALAAIEQIEVTDFEPLAAALLAAWIAGQLGWRPDSRPQPGETLWRRPDGGSARVRLGAGDQADGPRLTLAAPALGGEWLLQRWPGRPGALVLAAHCHEWCRLPAELPAPQPEAAGLALAALAAPSENAARARALAAAGWVLGWI
jgi:glucose-6-phosphate dehydrogenase assembly protein OpcA